MFPFVLSIYVHHLPIYVVITHLKVHPFCACFSFQISLLV